MCDHGHSHGSGSHDHGKAGLLGEELGVQYSLYQKIDLENVSCLNEEVEGSGKSVFKAWENRKSKDKYVVSDADEELLFNIPFTGNIKLKGKLPNEFGIFFKWNYNLSCAIWLLNDAI